MTFPTAAELAGHNLDDIDGNGYLHHQWMGDVGAALDALPRVRSFPFAFDTPNLLTGAAVYTPTAGDILLDAWIEIDTAWDGTTPRGDIGTFIGQPFGIWASWNEEHPIGLDTADSENVTGWLSHPFVLGSAHSSLASLAASFVNIGSASVTLARAAPLKFTTADPIKIVVSQDGTNTGADPGSTQGSAVLYLVTATPIVG